MAVRLKIQSTFILPKPFGATFGFLHMHPKRGVCESKEMQVEVRRVRFPKSAEEFLEEWEKDSQSLSKAHTQAQARVVSPKVIFKVDFLMSIKIFNFQVLNKNFVKCISSTMSL